MTERDDSLSFSEGMTNILELVCFQNGAPSVAYFLLSDSETTIGRAIGNSIVLNDDRCSRFHATIRFHDSKWLLTDLNSRNGTQVDGVAVKDEVELTIGSKIQIGRQTLLATAPRDFGEVFDSGEGTTFRNSNFFQRQNELTAYLNCERAENRRLRGFIGQKLEMIGSSAAIRKVQDSIVRAGNSKATVLIRGESGVGKELVAQAIHEHSVRSGGPMVCLNCAAFSESLLQSELFGHEKGAFTDAVEMKVGKFEAADKGTIFLDEIAEMNPALQATFLRVLEGAQFTRIGGNKPISVDVRVVAATNRNLEEEVTAGRFRKDLYYRLRVLEITVPPLRERVGDVDILADHFLARFSEETGRRYKEFSAEAKALLNAYRWPGNVRELKNIVERAVLMGNPPTVQKADLLFSALEEVELGGQRSEKVSNPVIKGTQEDSFVPISLKEMEKRLIQQTLELYAWNKSKTAKSLGIERTTLDRKIAAYEISRN